MGFWTIIPVKPLRRGKSRLAGILSDNTRTELNITLLENTLSVLSEVRSIDNILVISRDPQAMALARKFGARTLLERSDSNLNRALEVATSMIQRLAHRGLLILPADLPLLTSEDVQLVLEASVKNPVVRIAPDRHEVGTNALFISPPGLLRYNFGSESFLKHCSQAELAGAQLDVLHLQRIALDLDVPEDLTIISPKLAELIDELGSRGINSPGAQSVLNYKRRCLDLITSSQTILPTWVSPSSSSD